MGEPAARGSAPSVPGDDVPGSRLITTIFLAAVVSFAASPAMVAASPHASPSPSPSPEDSATSEPSPETSPTPEPSPSPADRPDGDAAAAAAATLTASATADPSTITVGDTTTITAQVTNTGDDTAEAVEVEVGLPAELAYVSSAPDGAEVIERTSTPGNELVVFTFESLAPGAGVSVTVTTEGLFETIAPGAPVHVVARSGGASAVERADVTILPEGVSLGLSTTTDALLAEVGDRIDYFVTVENTGPSTATEVVVVDLVPEEIEVVEAPLGPGVDAVLVSGFLGSQDIVWIIEQLPAGESRELHWWGTADRPGDLAADNSVEVSAIDIDPIADEHRVYLGAHLPTDVENPPFDPIEKRVVTMVPGETPPAGAPGTLPVTGGAPWVMVAAGAALVVVGVAMLRLSRPGRNRRNTIVAVLLASALAMTACVSSDDDAPPDSQAQSSPDISPEVKGRRIERGQNGDRPGDNAETRGDQGPGDPFEDGEAPGDGDEPAEPVVPPVVALPPVPQPEPEPVRRVRTVEVTLDELPTVAASSMEGDNVVSYQWDEGDSALAGAASSRTFSPGAAVELLTSLAGRDGAIGVAMTLTNTSDDTRVAVQGRLVHVISGETGRIARLESERIDVVLHPNGSTTAEFVYLLPTGSYEASGSFIAS